MRLRLLFVYLPFVFDGIDVSGLGYNFPKDRLNIRLNVTGIVAFTSGDLGACANLCMSLAECLSVNYYLTTKWCQLNNRTAPTDLVHSPGVVFLDMVDWSVVSGGPCSSKPCSIKHLCVPISTAWTCVYIGGVTNVIGRATTPKEDPTLVNPTTTVEVEPTDSTFEASSLLTPSIESTFQVSSLLTPSMESTFEVRSLLKPSMESTFEASSLQTPSMGSTFEASSLLTPSMESTFEASSLLTPSMESTFEASSLLAPSMESTFEANSLLTPSMESTFEANSLLTPSMKSTLEASFTNTEGVNSASTMYGEPISSISFK